MSDHSDKTLPILGPCCACGTTENVHTIMMLDRRAVIPGHGWGCALCRVPPDGAIAVLCDGCADAHAPVRSVCRGYPASDGRIPVEGFRFEPFGHDRAAHEYEEGMAA